MPRIHLQAIWLLAHFLKVTRSTGRLLLLLLQDPEFRHLADLLTPTLKTPNEFPLNQERRKELRLQAV